VLTSVLDTYVNVGWAAIVVPFASPYRPVWTGLGTVGVDLILAVAISSALRQRISAATWRGIHWLAYGSWPVAMAHSLGMGTDASRLWMDGLAAVCSLAVLASVAWRISDHRRSRERAVELGALTRAVPSPPRRAQTPSRAPSAQPRRVDSASRILEKEHS
jgi:methionine sulfoxide reductase heme-binding subunit